MNIFLLVSLIGAGLVSACTQDVDPAWQLDHDRVIAVRVTPNRIGTGESAVVDALLGRRHATPMEVDPDTAEVVSPSSLSAALLRVGTRWTIATPSDVDMAAARRELELAPGDPVPVRLRVTFAPSGLVALKIVWLGESAANPVLGPILIDGADRTEATSLSVARGVDIQLSVNFDDNFNVNWLTSCGTMHDFDLPNAYLRVEIDDSTSGTLGVVVRDSLGGVAWKLWPIDTH